MVGDPERSSSPLPEIAFATRRIMHFWVAGVPKTKGSTRSFMNPKTGKVVTMNDCKGAKDWHRVIALMARAHLPRGYGDVCQGFISLTMRFGLARPKGHYRANGELRPTTPALPGVKPDVSKLVRCAEDALTGVVWRDDSQVVRILTEKVYGQQGVAITVEEFLI